MNNITLSEFFKDKDGIATVFYTNFETDFNLLFDGVNVRNLDLHINFLYGTRLINEYLTNENYENLIKIFIELNLQKWKKLYNIATSNLNELANNEITLKTGTLSRENENENTDLNLSKVFNDTNFVENEKQINTQNGSNVDTYNLREEKTYNTDITEKQKNAVNFQQNFELKKQIIKEIVNYLTLKIY